MQANDPSQRILRAIRGEEAMPEAVAAAGIEVNDQGPYFELDAPSGVPVVRPSPTDVARGLVAMWARGGSDLQTWARYLLALPDVDLVDLEDHPSGDQILEGIWDVAAGMGVDERTLDAARAMVG